MKLNHEGLEEYLIELIDTLENDIREKYKKISLDDISSFVFTKPKTLYELNLNDEGYMLKLALHFLDHARNSNSMVEKLKKYLTAMTSVEVSGNKYRKKLIVSKLKKDAAAQRWEADPKSKDKAFVKDCWLEWKTNPDRYKSKASFAKDMLDKCEYLTNTKVIEDWCREWDKENRKSARRVRI